MLTEPQYKYAIKLLNHYCETTFKHGRFHLTLITANALGGRHSEIASLRNWLFEQGYLEKIGFDTKVHTIPVDESWEKYKAALTIKPVAKEEKDYRKELDKKKMSSAKKARAIKEEISDLEDEYKNLPFDVKVIARKEEILQEIRNLETRLKFLSNPRLSADGPAIKTVTLTDTTVKFK